MELNYYRKPWYLDVSVCPCDPDFVAYLRQQKLRGRTIFHYGSGAHHYVGRANHEDGNPNEVLSITASRQEYEEYMDFVIQAPIAARGYKVLFADIYTLTPGMLPNFDLISLFHLCEYYNCKNSAYAQLNDKSLFDLLLSKLMPDGKIFFYCGSDGFDATRGIIDEYEAQGKIVQEATFKTLLVYGHGDIVLTTNRVDPCENQ